jgi:hypothetical protein
MALGIALTKLVLHEIFLTDDPRCAAVNPPALQYADVC